MYEYIEYNKIVSMINGKNNLREIIIELLKNAKELKIHAPNKIERYSIYRIAYSDGINDIKFKKMENGVIVYDALSSPVGEHAWAESRKGQEEAKRRIGENGEAKEAEINNSLEVYLDIRINKVVNIYYLLTLINLLGWVFFIIRDPALKLVEVTNVSEECYIEKCFVKF